MKHKKIFRIFIKRLLLSGFLAVFFLFSQNAFAARYSTLPSNTTGYSQYVTPANIIGATNLNTQVKISDLFNSYKNYITPGISPIIVLQTTTPTVAPKIIPVPPTNPITIATDTLVAQSLQKLLSQPSVVAKLRGPQGLKGDTGAQGKQGLTGSAGLTSPGGAMSPIYIPVGINQPDPNHNFTGASIFNATQLSSGHFTTSTANITDLTVTGNTIVSGSLSFSGGGSFNPGLTLGSVAFQSASGLAQDNANFFYDATTHRLGLGTATPGAMLDLGTAGATLGVMRFAGNTSGNVTIQPAAAAGTWTLTLPNSGGTNGQFLQTNGSGVATWATVASGLTIGSTAIASGTSGRILYDNAGTLGEMTTTGSGTVLALATSPVFVTPTLGVASATSLTTPIIKPSSNSTTAIQITKADGTTNILNVDTTNSRIGLGTTTPVYTLDVNGDINIASGKNFLINGVAQAFGWTVDGSNNVSHINGNVGIGTASPISVLTIDGGGLTFGTDNSYDVGASGANRPRSLYVGTSTTTPLVIGGPGSTDSLTLRATSGGSAPGSNIIFQVGSNGATEAMRILDTGFVGVGTATPVSTLTTGGGHITVGPAASGAGNTGQLRFEELAANGSTYVGFKAPDLISASQIWTLPNADGTSGQVLQTNGSGVLTWAANAASGMSNPLTTTGDLIYASANGAPSAVTRLGIGSSGQCLVVTAGLPAWGACAGTAAAAGTNAQIQFNNSGSFGGDPSFVWNNSSKTLTLNNASSGAYVPLLVRNTTASTTSSAEIQIGNDAATNALDLKVNSSAFTGNANLASITNVNNAALAFGTNNTERMRILPSGFVGIGATNPSQIQWQLTTYSATTEVQNVLQTDWVSGYANNQYINPNGRVVIGKERTSGGGLLTGDIGNAGILATIDSNPFQFGTNNAVRMTIGAGGNVGIGITTLTNPATLFQVASPTLNAGVTTFQQGGAGVDGFNLDFRKSRGTVVAPTVLTTGDELGTINFNGYTAPTGFINSAAIKAISTGTVLDGVVPSFLSFWTGTQTTPTVVTEGMRLDQNQNLGVGTTAPSARINAQSTTEQLRLGYNSSNYASFTVDSSGNLTVSPTGSTILNNNVTVAPTSISNTGEVRLQELASNGTTYVGFKAPTLISSSQIWTLPNADGTTGQVLSTNGSGVLSWSTGSSSGMSNPLTTTGDLIYASNTAAPSTAARLAIGSTGQCLVVSGGVPTWGSCAGTATAAGADTQVQFNNGGAFGATSNFIYNNSTSTLTIDGGSNAAKVSLALRNNNAGNAASNELRIGNDAATNALSLLVNSSTFTGDANTASIINKNTTGALAFGTNNTEAMRISSAGLVGIGTTTPTAHLHIAGNLSTSAWTTNGIALNSAAASYTDTSSSGTVATNAVNAFGIPTLLASNATTYTNSANVYIAGAPVSSTNVTQTNPLALYVAGGVSSFAGKVGIGTTVPTVSQTTGLHIAGANAGIRLQNTVGTGWGYIEYYDQNAVGQYISGYQDINHTYRITPGTALASVTGFAMTSTGNIGIGTQTPVTLLHVATSTTATGITTFEQSSADSDSYDLAFRKSRGTNASPTVITTGDELGTVQFNGYSGAGGYVTGAAIKALSEGTVATTRIPANLSFWTGTDAAPTVLTQRMIIDSAGNVAIAPSTSSVTADFRLREALSNGTTYVGFKAPTLISTSQIWTLPSADGTANQVLQTNGSGVLSWAANSAGSGMANPLTTTGDIIYASNTAAPSTAARLGIGTAGQCLLVSGGLPAWGACSGSSAAAGSNTQVQFNNSGSFGADAGFTWDNAAKTLGLSTSTAGAYVPLAIRNTNNGNASTAELKIGNDTAANALSLLVNSSTFTGDANTATIANKNTTGALAFGTNSTERMRVTAAGLVGIGTNAPGALLDLSRPDDTGYNLQIQRTSATVRKWGFAVGSSGQFYLDDVTGNARALTIDTTKAVTLYGTTTFGADNSFDIGSNGSSRPRTGYFGTSLVVPQINTTGNISAASWTTNGIQYQGAAATFTDTGTAGTRATAMTNAFTGGTIAATNAVTVTDAATLYIGTAPAAGSNVTITNRWGLYSGAAQNSYMAGNLYLGTTSSPASALPLFVTGVSASQFNAAAFNNTQAAAADVGSTLIVYGAGVQQATVNTGWNAGATTDAYLAFSTRGSNAVGEKVRITSAGNVGIGTTTPSAKLEVNGSIKITGGSGGQIIFSDGSTMSTNSVSGTGTSSTTDLNFIADSDTNGSGAMTFAVNGSTRLAIANGGNIGIGQAAPTTRFDILPTASLGAAGVSGLLQEAHTVTLTGSNPTTYATLYGAQIASPTLVGTNAGQTVTDAAGLAVSNPIKSTNVAVTNSYGILIPSTGVSTATNAYGMKVVAPTGATNNYAASFMGGFVGIGTTAPTSDLHIVDNQNNAIGLTVTNTTNGNNAYASTNVTGQNNYILQMAMSDAMSRAYGGWHPGSDVLEAHATNGLNIVSNKGTSTATAQTGMIRFVTTNVDTTSQTTGNDSKTSMLIDSSGNVGIGRAMVTPGSLFNVATSTTALGVANFDQGSADTDSFDLVLRKARGTYLAPTVITTGDELGTLQFKGYGGTSAYVAGAAIKALSSGTVTDTAVPGLLSFWTATNTIPSVLTERMRIDNAGNVGIGLTNPTALLNTSGGNFLLGPTNTTTAAQIQFQEGSTAGTNYIALKAPDSGISSSITFTLPNADGSNGQVLQTNGSGVLSWSANSASNGLTNVLTTTGDILYASTTAVPAAPARLAIGTAGQCLLVSGGLPAWGACSGSSAAAGSNTQIQFNNSGSFGADAAFTWNNTNKTLGLSTSTAGAYLPLALRNTNAGSSSTNELEIGNDTAANALSLMVNSSGFTGDANTATIANKNTTGALAFSTNSTERARFTAAGNLGIGTTTPATTLDVNGVFTFRGNIIAGTDNTYDIGASGATRPRTGYFGTSIVAPIWRPQSDSTTAIQINKADGTTNIMNVDTTNSFIGIGTTTPVSALNVSGGHLTLSPASSGAGNTGQMRFQELAANGITYVGFKAPDLISSSVTFTLPNADGTNGQILQTNGAGVLSWAANAATGMSNPMTTTGDIIYGSTTANPSTPSRLAIGTAGQCLLVSGGLPAWGACSGSSAAAGSNTQIQFNNSGSFGADAALTWDNTAKTLGLSTTTAGAYAPLALRNTNAGNSSTAELKIGNDTAANALDLLVNSSTFTGDANTATIANKNTTGALAFGTNSTERMRILASGNVGIGTATAATTLDINGVTTFRGNIIAGTDNTYDLGAAGATRPRTIYVGTSVNTPLVENASTMNVGTSGFASLFLKSNGSARWELNTSGELKPQIVNTYDIGDATNTARTGYFGTSLISPLALGGTAAGSSLSLQSTNATGTTDFINFKVGTNGGTEAMRVIDSGNVGIGTTTPVSKLEVAGLTTFTQIPAGSGVSNGSAYINPSALTTGTQVAWTANPTWDNGLENPSNESLAMADVSGDGLVDMYVGGHAYQNVGSASVPSWAAQAGWNLPSDSLGTNKYVNLVDLNNDGLYDAVVGFQNGTFEVYQNTGSSSVPAWTLQAGWVLPSNSDANAHINAACADLDNDGKVDCLEFHQGGTGGSILAYQNTGTPSVPAWTAKAAWNGPNVGTYGNIALVDLDNDGDKDLLYWVYTSGPITAYENIGNASSPVWAAKAAWNGPATTMSFPPIAVADVNGDGAPDLFYGNSSKVVALQNTGSGANSSNFTLFGAAVAGTQKFRLNGSGSLEASGNLTLSSGYQALTYSGATTALTVTQNGVGNSLDLFDGANNVFTVKHGGNIGIGTTSPASILAIGSSDLGNGTAGPVITLGRNTNGTNTGAGSINFLSKGGTAGFVWQDNAGNLRINSAAPTNANDTAGTVVGAQTSTRDTKQDITDYTDYNGALTLVMNSPLHTFRYIREVQGYGTDSPLAKAHIGYIADEVDPIFMQGNTIDQVSVNGILMGSIKELNLNLESLSGQITPAPGSAAESFSNAFFNNIKTKIGAWLADATNGVAKIFTAEVDTKSLCVSDNAGAKTCISKSQLDALLAGAGASSGSGSGSGSSGGSGGGSSNGGSNDTTPPVLTLNGDATMNLNVGDVYNEASAMGVDDKDSSVAIIITGSVDTTTVGTYTIHYNATDNAGNHAIEITRTVNVNAVTPPTP